MITGELIKEKPHHRYWFSQVAPKKWLGPHYFVSCGYLLHPPCHPSREMKDAGGSPYSGSVRPLRICQLPFT